MIIMWNLFRFADVILLEELISAVTHPFAPKPSRAKILLVMLFAVLVLFVIAIIGYVFVAIIVSNEG